MRGERSHDAVTFPLLDRPDTAMRGDRGVQHVVVPRTGGSHRLRLRFP